MLSGSNHDSRADRRGRPARQEQIRRSGTTHHRSCVIRFIPNLESNVHHCPGSEAIDHKQITNNAKWTRRDSEVVASRRCSPSIRMTSCCSNLDDLFGTTIFEMDRNYHKIWNVSRKSKIKDCLKLALLIRIRRFWIFLLLQLAMVCIKAWKKHLT
jgi:hypothetical protein